MEPCASASALIALRKQALELFRDGVSASDPEKAVSEALEPRRQMIAAARRVILIAFGKAACPMVQGALPFLGSKLHAACAVTNPENLAQLDDRVAILAGGHPLPDENSLRAGQLVEELARSAGPGDLLLVLISGGGSTLLCAPAPGIALADKIALNDELIRSGADIREINAVRQAFSRLKSGRLAQLATGAQVLSLILSDVPGNDISTIASGPTAKPREADAWAVLDRYGLTRALPAAMREHLNRFACQTGRQAASFDHVENMVIGGNNISLKKVMERAGSFFPAVVKANDWLDGDVSDAAYALHKIALYAARETGPIAIVAGGELTVKVKGGGKGGRNQELALRFAVLEESAPIGRQWVFLSGATDGRDGPTDAAGGIVDAGSTGWMRQFGCDPDMHLANNDSYPALASSGDLLLTGATGTNVADLQILLMR